MNHQKFVHQDLNGNPWGIVTIEQMWEDKYILKYNKPDKNLNLEDWLNLFSQAKSKGIELGAKQWVCACVWNTMRIKFGIF